MLYHSPWVHDTEVFTVSEGASLNIADIQVDFQAAGRVLFQRALPFHSFLGSALCRMAQCLSWSLGKARKTQSSVESPHNTPSSWHHFWPVSTFILRRPFSYLPKSLHFCVHGGKQLMTESYQGAMGTTSLAELDVNVTHESHCPMHLAMLLYFSGVTMLKVLDNSQCSGIQPSYVHFNVEGAEIKMT